MIMKMFSTILLSILNNSYEVYFPGSGHRVFQGRLEPDKLINTVATIIKLVIFLHLVPLPLQ
jgi:hypothetical protein